MKFYRLGDRVPFEDRQRLGTDDAGYVGEYRNYNRDGEHVMAVRTAEFRAPKKGEWYLSGAVPVAYRAPNDLSTEYRIMKLVVVIRETVTRERIKVRS